jgi:hypothetical protein
MFRRSIFILGILIIVLCAPVGFMVTGASAQDQPPPEEFIPEGDPTPPPVLTVQNPELVVVPSGEAQVYMVPNMAGVYFYGGRWYRHHHGVWFSANVYNEPWVFVEPPMVPSFVVGISPFYPFYLPRGYYRIHYGEFHSHWRTWDRERHWHNQPWYKNERRAEVRHTRERQAHARMEKDRHQRQERVRTDKVGYKNRLAEHERHNKPTHSDKTDKTGKVDKTGKIDKTGKTGKIDKTGSTGSTTKTGGITKTGGATTKTSGTGTAGSTGNTTKTGGITKTSGATTKTVGTGTTRTGSTTKTGGTTKVSNQPKPQVQQRVQQQPKPQTQQRVQQQPKPQVQQRVQQQPKPKPQPRTKENDNKHNVR